MNERTSLALAAILACTLCLPGCGSNSSESGTNRRTNDDAHQHGAGENAGHDHGDTPDDQDHHHEVSMGTVRFGDLDVELAQSHGELAPGKELHLVVKLPYSDNGATVVRAWLGTEDRFASVVAKAEYAPSHDDYDIHAIAPDPLPESTMWWIEIEMPDGAKLLGSVKPH